MPKSELVRISDRRLVFGSNSVQKLNDFVQFSDKNLIPKAKLFKRSNIFTKLDHFIHKNLMTPSIVNSLA